MKVESTVTTATEEVKVVTLVEKKTLHINIEVDQQFLDFINCIGLSTDADLRRMGATPEQIKSVYHFYSSITQKFRDTEGKEVVKCGGNGPGYTLKK